MKANGFSVFIPTYKRKKSLEAAIISVFKHFGRHSLTDIVISDNDNTSTTTSSLITNLKTSCNYNNIFYHQNADNIGIDKNMLNVLSLCDTDYCLMLGDDDVILPNFYEVVSKHLDDNYDFILLNADPACTIPTGNITHPAQSFAMLWHKMPYGTIIINLKKARQISQNFNKYIGTNHAYSAMPWEIMCSDASAGQALFINEIVVGLGQIEKTWSAEKNKIYYKDIPVWFNLLPDKLNARRIKFKYYIMILKEHLKQFIKYDRSPR